MFIVQDFYLTYLRQNTYLIVVLKILTKSLVEEHVKFYRVVEVWLSNGQSCVLVIQLH